MDPLSAVALSMLVTWIFTKNAVVDVVSMTTGREPPSRARQPAREAAGAASASASSGSPLGNYMRNRWADAVEEADARRAAKHRRKMQDIYREGVEEPEVPVPGTAERTDRPKDGPQPEPAPAPEPPKTPEGPEAAETPRTEPVRETVPEAPEVDAQKPAEPVTGPQRPRVETVQGVVEDEGSDPAKTADRDIVDAELVEDAPEVQAGGSPALEEGAETPEGEKTEADEWRPLAPGSIPEQRAFELTEEDLRQLEGSGDMTTGTDVATQDPGAAEGGLRSHIDWTSKMSQLMAVANSRLEMVKARMAATDNGPKVLGLAAQIAEFQTIVDGLYEQLNAELTSHLVVAEAHAATGYQAGNKDYMKD